MGDHTEAIQIDFDPTIIGFKVIGDMFWKSHNPCASPYSRQYMSAIWFHDNDQRLALEKQQSETIRKHGQELKTQVLPFNGFYLAENYHQKYRLQSRRVLMKTFNEFYPSFNDFNNSTAAARLNGMVGGNRVLQLFKEEGESYGFDFETLKQLIR